MNLFCCPWGFDIQSAVKQNPCYTQFEGRQLTLSVYAYKIVFYEIKLIVFNEIKSEYAETSLLLLYSLYFFSLKLETDFCEK